MKQTLLTLGLELQLTKGIKQMITIGVIALICYFAIKMLNGLYREYHLDIESAINKPTNTVDAEYKEIKQPEPNSYAKKKWHEIEVKNIDYK